MVQLVLRITSGPGGAGRIAEALASLAVPAQAEAGHVQSLVMAEVGEPRRLWYVEVWADQQAVEHRIESSSFSDLISLLETSVEQPLLEVRFVSTVRGLEYVNELRSRLRQSAERFA